MVLHLPNQKLDTRASGWKAKLKQLDPLGNLVFFPGIVCLLLALQWGGTEYAWDSARIIVLLVLCVVLCLTFIGIQIWKQEKATIPPRIAKQRSVAAAVWCTFFNGATLTLIYYLPIWFQAVKGVSAVKSGIMLLPMVLATVFGTLSSGFLVSKIGYYNPFFVLGSITMPIGAGLIATFTPSSGQAKILGSQVLVGLGMGFSTQQPSNVVQTVLDKSDMAAGTALIMFMRFLGSAIFLPVAQNIFINSLVSKLTNLPNISTSTVINGGATDLRNLVSGDNLSILLSDYSGALIPVFYLVTGTSSVTIFGSLLVEWRSLRGRGKEQEASTSTPVETAEVKESV